MLFASDEPLDEATLTKQLPDGIDIKASLEQLQADYAMRGVNLVRINGKWTFRTAADLSWLMTRESTETRKLSRAAIEMLAIIAYHQPVTRAEIEEIRGVVDLEGHARRAARDRLDPAARPPQDAGPAAHLRHHRAVPVAFRPGGGRRPAGPRRTAAARACWTARLPGGFSVPTPSDDPQLREDEDPLEPGDLDLALAPARSSRETERRASRVSADLTKPSMR